MAKTLGGRKAGGGWAARRHARAGFAAAGKITSEALAWFKCCGDDII